MALSGMVLHICHNGQNSYDPKGHDHNVKWAR